MCVRVAHAAFVLQWAAGENSARDLGAHQAAAAQPAVWGELFPQAGEPPEARYILYHYNHCWRSAAAVDHQLRIVFSASFVEKFWFCRLSLNHKVLHYGDLDESPQGEVPFELLSDKSKIPLFPQVAPSAPHFSLQTWWHTRWQTTLSLSVGWTQ